MERVINYNTQYKGNMLVITGFIDAGGIKDVYVQKTVHPLVYEEDADLIDSASVKLIVDNEISVELRKEADGFYRSPQDLILLPGKNIMIEVAAPGLQSAYSSPQKMPNKPVIDSIRCSILKITKQSQNLTIQVYFKSDKSIQFYGINFKAYYMGRESSSRDSSSLYYTLFQEVFDEKTMTTNPGHYLINTDWRQTSFDSITVKLSAISEDIYHFMKSLDYYESSRGDLFMDPTIVFTNINGGYGIFGLYNSTCFKFVNKY